MPADSPAGRERVLMITPLFSAAGYLALATELALR